MLQHFGGARTAALGLLTLLFISICASIGMAEHALTCGQPVSAYLAPDAEDTYLISTAGNAVVVADAVRTGGSLDLLDLEAGGHETCGGSLAWTVEGSSELQVRDCRNGQHSGTYTLNLNVVSQGPDNCAETMPCGIFPYVRRLVNEGGTDSYSFLGKAGDKITIRATAINGAIGAMRVRLFDPDGTALASGDTCSGMLNTTLSQNGTYTALISACGLPKAGLYLLAFESGSCPSGPDMTFLGLAKADGSPLPPDDYDDQGRPVYNRDGGAGFLMVFEARPGSSRKDVGTLAYNYDPTDPTVVPDLEVLLSRALGDGSTAVCDKTRPNIGGVPGVPSLSFDTQQSVSNAINDFGCRIDNGAGQPEGVSSDNACTSFPNGDFGFVERTSSLQFCMLVSGGWQFQPGATIVKARTRDTLGNLGAPREMVLQVSGPTFTPTPQGTPTPTRSSCVGDCNEDGDVTVDELIKGVSIAIGNTPVGDCAAVDVDHDGAVTIDELIKAVTSALGGCAV
ncbi:MAG: hypothetical protein HY270_07510 [Deltaproteobacteria bacterium]|nr:hypothetical protein [Deltaproteobacteria bacterium]